MTDDKLPDELCSAESTAKDNVIQHRLTELCLV